jgi:hypothetical protein
MRVSNRDGFKCVEEPVLQFVWAMDYVAQERSIVDRNLSPGKLKRGGASAKENAMKGATERLS